MAPRKDTARRSKTAVHPDAEREVTRLPYLTDAALGLNRDKPGWATERRESNNHPPTKSTAAATKPRFAKKKTLCPLAGKPKTVEWGDSSLPANESYAPSLPALDERVLILYHSSLKRKWKQLQQQEVDVCTLLAKQYSHEAIYASTQIQKIARGVAARKRWQDFYCLRNQAAASRIQLAFRRLIVYRKTLMRLENKRTNRVTRIQAWYRGCRCRDFLIYQRIRIMNQRIVNFQRYIRGRRLWRIVMAILHQRRSDVAVQIQRCYRGWKGRQRAVAIRFEQNRHVRRLQYESSLHTQSMRCKGCDLDTCTEDSLFACFIVRYVGLHDFSGARALGEDGIRLYPLSSKFSFFYAVLLQAMGEDLETSMAFLKRAKEIGINDEEILKCEKCYFLPAHLLHPNDAQPFLDLAILYQSHDQLSRAEANYSKALLQSPPDYVIPGYLHRVDMVDRLLLNYHRFCSIFNFRQVNVLVKEVSTSKKGKKARVMLSKFNHYTVIAPTDGTRMNTVYLTDDEILTIIKPPSREGDKVKVPEGGNTGANFRGITSWGGSALNSSMRQKSFRSLLKDTPGRSSRSISQQPVFTQLFQREFVGLNVRPRDLAQFSESRSKLRLTKTNAELLINELVFVESTDELSRQEALSPQKIMMIPSVLKLRQQHRSAVVRTHAAIHIQRIHRGFHLRTEVRRDKLLSDIKHQQVDEMYRRLHENYLVRELRRSSAVAIQRIYKGYAFRNLHCQWQTQACNIQRTFRGYRGRLRAAAFRDGACSLYMAQRVFQRGINISGRLIMLIIEKCGLSFRLSGYDLEECVTYHGFFSLASTMRLLCYLNWTYGETLRGREFTRKGDKLMIWNASSVNRSTGECFVNCRPLTTVGGIVEVALADCVQSINLRSLGAGDHVSLEMPILSSDTARLVEAIADRACLTPALQAPARELKAKGCGLFTISIQPPPQMHFTYKKPRTTCSTESTSSVPLQNTSRLDFVFPVVEGLRGVSIGKEHYRKKCGRHAVQFTRCRCILPIVSTSAHIAAISLALSPPALSP